MEKTLDGLFKAVSNDREESEGVIENCRWRYSPTSSSKRCGTLSLATANGFDSWGISAIVHVETAWWDTNDPEFEKFVRGFVQLFSMEEK